MKLGTPKPKLSFVLQIKIGNIANIFYFSFSLFACWIVKYLFFCLWTFAKACLDRLLLTRKRATQVAKVWLFLQLVSVNFRGTYSEQEPRL